MSVVIPVGHVTHSVPENDMTIQLLGILAVNRARAPLLLPKSRKVRALIAYLSIADQPATREQLCELLGDNTSDPRGELRWCLSKIRRLLEGSDCLSLVTRGEFVELRMPDSAVDALTVQRAVREDIRTLDLASVRTLADLFRGEFADTMALDRSPHFNAWLTAKRLQFRGFHIDILKRLLELIPGHSPDVIAVLQTWLRLAPLDQSAHERMFEALICQRRFSDGSAYAIAVMRLFDAEGLDSRWVQSAWLAARNRT
jgi:DNA-binding SARP family transcriptional activator